VSSATVFAMPSQTNQTRRVSNNSPALLFRDCTMSHLSPSPSRTAARRPTESPANSTVTVQFPIGKVGEATGITITIAAMGTLSPHSVTNALERAVRLARKGIHLDMPAFLAFLEAIAEEARLEQATEEAKTRIRSLLTTSTAPEASTTEQPTEITS
jgi:hypothetical protein